MDCFIGSCCGLVDSHGILSKVKDASHGSQLVFRSSDEDKKRAIGPLRVDDSVSPHLAGGFFSQGQR